MKISSFDIFDTCLVRRCGTPEDFFDVFSRRAFNGYVSENDRQEFIAARRIAQQSIQSSSTTLKDIWDNFKWTQPSLKSKEELYQLEQAVEREMLVPVLYMRDKVNECRKRGDRIIFISDMYLSSAFLISLMRENGFYQDGDALYVSCECNAMKYNGDLFRYVKEKEQISSRDWHHYGDSEIGDFKAPGKLGIKATKICNDYTYYQKQWLKQGVTTGCQYASILAGISRSLRYSMSRNEHTDFVLDLIAPLYSSLVYRMMRDAEQRGIKRLYFCARDAYMMLLVAQQYASFFPDIECKFLYISKKSLYEGDEKVKEAYFMQEGLASKKDKAAIVDFRSSGKTLWFLNNWLSERGYLPVRGYYYEMFDLKDLDYCGTDYYCEVNAAYAASNKSVGRLLAHPSLMEQFFPLNTLQRTVGYVFSENGGVEPIFDAEEKQTSENEKFGLEDKAKWADYHKDIIVYYAKEYAELVALFSDDIFRVVLASLADFLTFPSVDYIEPLCHFHVTKWNGHGFDWVPYVKKCSLLHLLRHKGKNTAWRRATLLLSTPRCIHKIIKKRGNE